MVVGPGMATHVADLKVASRAEAAKVASMEVIEVEVAMQVAMAVGPVMAVVLTAAADRARAVGRQGVCLAVEVGRADRKVEEWQAAGVKSAGRGVVLKV